MTLDAFRAALRQGHGRAYSMLERDGPAPYREALLEACLQDERHDPQADHSRGDYLLALLRLARMEHEVLEILLATLPTEEERADQNQMTDLLGAYAVTGSARAELALFARAAGGDPRAENNLSRLVPRGLEWLEAHVVPQLDASDDWRVGSWLRRTPPPFPHPVQQRLQRLHEASRARREQTSARKPGTDSVQEFLRAVQKGKAPRTSPAFFAREATEAPFQEASEVFLSSTSRPALLKLRWIFRDRPFPLPLERLFEQAEDEVRGKVVRALLGERDDPRVREWSLARLARRPPAVEALETLRRSFRPGDERVITAWLPSVLEAEDDQVHAAVLSLGSLLSDTPGFPGQAFAEWIYAHSPCAFCRHSAVDWMVEHGHLPEALREEARHDAEPDTRALAER